MESAGQEIVGVGNEQTKWAREYDLRWSKAMFLMGMVLGAMTLWNVWKYVPDLTDKLCFSFLLLIPAMLGSDVWKMEKRGEMKRPAAQSFLMFLALLTMFSTGALAKVFHVARAAAEVVK